MEPEILRGELAAIREDIASAYKALEELLKETKEITEFIALMQEVVAQMSGNPMLSMFLPASVGGNVEHPKLPGM